MYRIEYAWCVLFMCLYIKHLICVASTPPVMGPTWIQMANFSNWAKPFSIKTQTEGGLAWRLWENSELVKAK